MHSKLFWKKRGKNGPLAGYFCSRTDSYFNPRSAEARKVYEGLQGTILEMKVNKLLCQDKFTKLNLSNISFYLIITIILNDPYINIHDK